MCVVAEVTEQASGIKQTSFDSSTLFTDLPVKLDCDLSPPFYRPQLPLLVTVSAGISLVCFESSLHDRYR